MLTGSLLLTTLLSLPFLLASQGVTECPRGDLIKERNFRKVLQSLNESKIPRSLAVSQGAEVGFLPLESYLTQSLGWDDANVLVTQISDLQFIPFTLPGSHILLVVKEGATLHRSQSQMVLAKASENRIKVSVFYLGKQDHIALQSLANSTGGHYLNAADALKQTCLPLASIY